MAWSYELLSWSALVDGRYHDTVAFARTGLELAPASSAGVQLAVQQAKAWSRLGDRREAETAMRTAAGALAGLPVPSNPEHHFVFDPPKLSFYAATCYTWLGELDRAEEHARTSCLSALRYLGWFAGRCGWRRTASTSDSSPSGEISPTKAPTLAGRH